MAYDRQVIVQLGFDDVISRNAQRLQQNAKIPSALVQVRGAIGMAGAIWRSSDLQALTSAFSSLTNRSRVYLQAHGAWKSQHLDMFSGQQVAMMLASAKMPSVETVSVLGCSLARDAGTRGASNLPGARRVDYHSVSSFAAELHKVLKQLGIGTSVYARVFDVAIGPDGSKGVFADDIDDRSVVNKLTDSKLVFSWSGDQQVREWAY